MRVASAIREAIFHGEQQPAEPVRKMELSASLGVARGMLRLNDLEHRHGDMYGTTKADVAFHYLICSRSGHELLRRFPRHFAWSREHW